MDTFIHPEDIQEDAFSPKYHQLYTQLKKELFFGERKKGERFFSVRDIQNTYSLNMKTVRAAVDLLIADGFLTSKPMSGLYVNRTKNHRADISMGNVWFYQFTGDRSYPFYNSVLMALQQQTAAMGMNVIVNHSTSLADLKRWFRPETGDGLVVTGDIDIPIIHWLESIPNLRYVVVGNYDLPPDVPNIHINVTAAVYRAMKISSQANRRKVALITNPNAKMATREIKTGISRANKEGLVDLVGEVLDPREDGYASMAKLKQSGCDCILVSEISFFGLCRYVFENKIKYPEELFIIRYGKNEENNIYSEVAAINIVSDKTLMAQKIISILFSRAPIKVEMDCDVVDVYPQGHLTETTK